MQIKYVGGIDEIEIPDFSITVERGKAFEVTAEQAAQLLPQAENYEPADDESEALLKRLDAADDEGSLEALTVPQLKDLAATEGADVSGLTKKDDLIAAIESHRENEGA